MSEPNVMNKNGAMYAYLLGQTQALYPEFTDGEEIKAELCSDWLSIVVYPKGHYPFTLQIPSDKELSVVYKKPVDLSKVLGPMGRLTRLPGYPPIRRYFREKVLERYPNHEISEDYAFQVMHFNSDYVRVYYLDHEAFGVDWPTDEVLKNYGAE